MFNNTTLNAITPTDLFRIRIQGTLFSRFIDWYGDITLVNQEHDQALLVTFTLDVASLQSFLSQFQELNLSLVPGEFSERENYPGARTVSRIRQESD